MRGSNPLRRLWRALPRRGGLGRRILLWFLVLSLIPLLFSNSIGYLVSRRIIESQLQRYLEALTEVEARRVGDEVERHQLYLAAAIAGDGFLGANLPEAASAARAGQARAPVAAAVHERLDLMLETLGPVSELLVIDTSGRVIAATNHRRLGADYSECELFRRASRERVFWQDHEVRQEQVRPRLWLGAPIHDRDGKPVGVLAGYVHFDQFQAFLRIESHLARDVHAYIIDRDGRPVFVSHPHTVIEYGEPFPTPLTARPPKTVARYVNYEGVEVFGTSVAIPGIPWLYISEVPVTSALGQLRRLAFLAAALEGLFALLLVGIVWTVARSIVAPLRRLVGAAELIRSGELGVTVQVESDDELGDLGRTFNQMSEELRASSDKIQEFHEQEMRRAAQLASVGELASGIAHEVKNPLVGVASGVDLLADHSKSDQKAQGILRQIRTQVGRIESAIHDLLSYARPKDPRLVLIDPLLLLDRIVNLVRPQAEAAGVEISNIEARDVPGILGDPDQLTQGLVNLALNGIQAMRLGGVLSLSYELAGHDVRIAVSDTGCGIEPDRIEEIFRPFHTTKHQGTGLGLAITRGIVERHGGHLEVESEQGKGSTFTVVIEAAGDDRGVSK